MENKNVKREIINEKLNSEIWLLNICDIKANEEITAFSNSQGRDINRDNGFKLKFWKRSENHLYIPTESLLSKIEGNINNNNNK